MPSAIEWTEETWNPVTGCTKISPGCKHCYAEKMHGRLTAMGQAKYQRPFGVVTTHDDALTIPLRWKKPRTIFVNSMSDLFHKDVPDTFIDRVFAVMALCPQHTFYVLTKREDRMAKLVLGVRNSDRFHDINVAAQNICGTPHYGAVLPTQRDGMVPGGWPLRNVRIGVTVEDQQRADERFPHLCELGEAGWNTMVSAEPLLGQVIIPERYLALGKRAWVIAGGESGSKARPTDDAWILSLIGQCRDAGVPAFVKQRTRGGKKLPFEQWPERFKVREMPEVLR